MEPKLILKYILIGIITFIAIRYIPTTTLLQDDILIISFIVSIGYAIIDYIGPSVSYNAVQNPAALPMEMSTRFGMAALK